MIKEIPVETLLDAYAQGVFPMAQDGEILWFCPEERGIIPLDERFHIPHGLKKTLKKKPFELKWNTAFREVMIACAEREETWINDIILESYCRLHELGFAHSVECWDEEGLQGGLYGVEMAGVFFGESMFSRKVDASKVALVDLVERLREMDFRLLDTQWMTDHLRQFGGYEMPREQYLKLLGESIQQAVGQDQMQAV